MTTICPSELNCGIKRWVIDAPGSSQYEECAEGEWCEWDDVSAALMRLDGEHRAKVRELEAENDRLDEAFEDAAEERQYVESRAEAAEQKLADAEARVRELEHELDGCSHVQPAECYSRLAAAEQKLADANALIGECLEHGLKIGAPRLRLRMRAHLAGQPAAPTVGERCATCGQRLDAESDRDAYHSALLQPAAPSRTPLPPRSIVGRPELTEEFPDDAEPSRPGMPRARFAVGVDGLARAQSAEPAAPSRPHCDDHAGWRSDCERCAMYELPPAAPSRTGQPAARRR